MALVKNGPTLYVENVHARVMAVTVDDIVMPVVIAEGNWEDSNVCSPLSHYVTYPMEELKKRHGLLLRSLLAASLSFRSLVLRTGRADRIIYVNNWLFATNPCPELTAEQIDLVTSLLKDRFPDYAIVCRSINTYMHKDLYNAFSEQGYRMLRSRRICILDPAGLAYRRARNVRRDLKLVEKGSYEVVDTDGLTSTDVLRMTELYRGLYLNEYSFLNPQLTEHFFQLTMERRILAFKALRRDGRIDAFSCYYVDKGIMTALFLGYDTKLPGEVGLYRQIIALTMAEAEREGLLLHLSAGVDHFKILRGAIPWVEFDAVYYAHLPRRRRLAWEYISSSLRLRETLARVGLPLWKGFPARRVN
jgi:hypothetical protein